MRAAKRHPSGRFGHCAVRAGYIHHREGRHYSRKDRFGRMTWIRREEPGFRAEAVSTWQPWRVSFVPDFLSAVRA
jgi:hypothetical protein